MASSDPKRFGVLVLGMHRSGTSVAARLVNLLGFSLGPEEDLLPPQPDNPSGFWENARLIALNEEILLALDGDWSRPPRLDDDWVARPELDSLRPAAVALADSVFCAKQWVWKDPRNCLTLPFWLRLIDPEAAIILVYRNPLEVAKSLRLREGFAEPISLALWERYTRSALAAAQGFPVCVTSYEQLMRDPEGWCRQVGEFLRERGAEIDMVDPGEVASAVRSDLRHSTFSEATLARAPAVLSTQRAIYAALATCLGTHEAFRGPKIPPEAAWVEALLDERWLNLHATRGLRRAEAARQDAQAKLSQIESSRSYRLLGPLRTLSRIVAASDRGHAENRL